MGASRWKIRIACGEDLNFLYSTWLNSYRCDSLIGRSTKKSIFFDEYKRVLDSILSATKTETLIACLPQDEKVILGYLVFEEGILHYVFTKQDFRRMGIARSLFSVAFGDGVSLPSHTHLTRTGREILKSQSGLTYNPFLLFSRVFTETK